MKIINLGNNLYTNYIIQTEKGCILVDAGNKTSYSAFLAALKKHGIDKSEIKNVVLTHVHADHVSYLKELLEDVKPALYVGAGARENLLLGKDKHIKYSSKFNRKLTELSLKIMGGPAGWEAFDIGEYHAITVSEATYIEGFDAVIIPLPGHTLDSIGVLKKEGVFFVGDAIMNTLPARHLVPLLLEDEGAFKKSFEALIDSGAAMFYPGHGGAVTKSGLLENKADVVRVRAYEKR